MSTPAQRSRMAKAILDFEARRDKAGHLAVYHLPANDGGGRYEVGGINERYDGPMVRKLVALLDDGKYEQAETEAVEYIAGNTDPAAALTMIPSVESYLRDTVFNRGQRGAVRTLQRALDVPDDGAFGPATKAAMRAAESAPQDLLRKLRQARESYEREVVGYRANFWNGLVNRWDKSLVVAKTFPDTPDPQTKPPEKRDVLANIDLPTKIIAAMRRLGYAVAEKADELTIVYVEGMDPDGRPNGNAPNQFNDIRCVIRMVDGKAVMAGCWEGTTEPSRYWTENPMQPGGAARIQFGQYSAWTVGMHHDHEALIQTEGQVTICRDGNADYKRDGDRITSGFYGINQHWGYDLPRTNLANSSAGCLVGRTRAGHREFMALIKSDARYRSTPDGFHFPTAILPAAEVLRVVEPPKPVPPPAKPDPSPTVPPAAQKVGLGASILAALGAAWHWLDAHPAVVIVAVTAAAIATAILVHRLIEKE